MRFHRSSLMRTHPRHYSFPYRIIVFPFFISFYFTYRLDWYSSVSTLRLCNIYPFASICTFVFIPQSLPPLSAGARRCMKHSLSAVP
ncbi:hypothetical protein BC827DRAFT_1175847 [Russula dissimulans]|nr:hypothetical protein BC827DRAFT_1175847 [Russula dissimulans]